MKQAQKRAGERRRAQIQAELDELNRKLMHAQARVGRIERMRLPERLRGLQKALLARYGAEIRAMEDAEWALTAELEDLDLWSGRQ